VLRALRLPTLFLHAPSDAVVGIGNARRLFLAAHHPKSFVSLDASDHLLSDPADAEYAGRVILAWASRYLESRAGQPAPKESDADPGADALSAEEGMVMVRVGRERYRTDILASGHELLADEPMSAGGGNAGATPYDLLTAALGACTAITLRMYADRKEWPLEEVRVRLRHRRVHASDERIVGAREAKMDHIASVVDVRGDLDREQREKLLEVAGKCPVRRSLMAGVDIESALEEASDDTGVSQPEP
jgi:putative redox protein